MLEEMNIRKPLTEEQIDQLITQLCKELHLPPLIGTERPFLVFWDPLRQRNIIYPTANLARYLRRQLKLSIEIISDEESIRRIIQCPLFDRLHVAVVAVRVTAPDGDSVTDIGVVPVTPVDGADIKTARAIARENANAFMRALTKAERRAIFKLVGIPMADLEEGAEETPEAVPIEAVVSETTPPPPPQPVDKEKVTRAIQAFENLDLFEDE